MEETKQKYKRLIALVVIVIAAIIAVMTVSYVKGSDENTETRQESVSSAQNAAVSANKEETDQNISNDEALGKITGEDDDFTMVADPSNFDVKITGFEGNITLLTSTEDVLHQQMKTWLDENEFWDMTEVSYTGKYLRDEVSQSTTVYFQISRYPISPLLATWNPNTKQYSFTIEWH